MFELILVPLASIAVRAQLSTVAHAHLVCAFAMARASARSLHICLRLHRAVESASDRFERRACAEFACLHLAAIARVLRRCCCLHTTAKVRKQVRHPRAEGLRAIVSLRMVQKKQQQERKSSDRQNSNVHGEVVELIANRCLQVLTVNAMQSNLHSQKLSSSNSGSKRFSSATQRLTSSA